MIAKEQTIPIKLLKIEALLRRLQKKHPQWSMIEKDYIKIKAGYNGEKSLGYYLSDLPYHVLFDIRLCNNQKYFQIDALILSTKFALILEVKNYYGTLLFDSTCNQFIRISENKEEGFPNPIAQAQRQQLELKKWMESQKHPAPPIEYLIVISNPSTILKTNSANPAIFENIVHIQYLLEYIHRIQKKYSLDKINNNHLKKWVKMITKMHTPSLYDPIHRYKLETSEIVKGAFCKECNAIPMVRKHGTWLCKICGNKDKHAHLQAIEDYFLLISPSITNQKFRDFLLIHSTKTASRLLSELNLPFTGSLKGRVYYQSVHHIPKN